MFPGQVLSCEHSSKTGGKLGLRMSSPGETGALALAAGRLLLTRLVGKPLTHLSSFQGCTERQKSKQRAESQRPVHDPRPLGLQNSSPLLRHWGGDGGGASQARGQGREEGAESALSSLPICRGKGSMESSRRKESMWPEDRKKTIRNI